MPIRSPDNPARISVLQPAPGDLEIVQAFANTTGPEVEDDVLASPEGLAGWLIDRGFFAEGTELSEDDRRRAVEVRWGLRSLLAANAGARFDPEAVQRLKEATDASRFRLSFDDAGPSGVEPAAPTFDDALGHLLEAVARARAKDRFKLFKLCARSGCRRAFFDFSQNHGAMFCTRRCADRERTRAFRKTPKYRSRG